MNSIGRALAVVALSATIGVLGGGVASAGEVNGNGDSLKQPDGSLHGKSICAFSGLNDNYVAGNPLPDEDGFTHTQNWGQVSKDGKRFLTSIGVSPGKACNPNTPPPEEH